MAINSNIVSHFLHFHPDDDWRIHLKHRQNYFPKLMLVTDDLSTKFDACRGSPINNILCGKTHLGANFINNIGIILQHMHSSRAFRVWLWLKWVGQLWKSKLLFHLEICSKNAGLQGSTLSDHRMTAMYASPQWRLAVSYPLSHKCPIAHIPIMFNFTLYFFL